MGSDDEHACGRAGQHRLDVREPIPVRAIHDRLHQPVRVRVCQRARWLLLGVWVDYSTRFQTSFGWKSWRYWGGSNWQWVTANNWNYGTFYLQRSVGG